MIIYVYIGLIKAPKQGWLKMQKFNKNGQALEAEVDLLLTKLKILLVGLKKGRLSASEYLLLVSDEIKTFKNKK